ncbi:hypothetical protein [Variovorax sp. 770b2]|uniref:hypothetical protein n=1 Tax=Variovorax sp. 770b2 TaxID=1566271 RepID=UPI0008F2B8E1|nr:hypothetical protein [Variovorax sp. 770b2]SFP94852.1 hypothetical protein SAMN03159339_4833 [Variovorax sp. 770b2]
MRNITHLLAVLATSLAAVAAHAEAYEGVHQGANLRERDAVAAEAVSTAHAPNQNVTRGSRGADPFTSTASAQSVYEDAVLTAHAPDQNVSSGSRVNSVVVSTMPAAKAQASIAPATRF